MRVFAPFLIACLITAPAFARPVAVLDSEGAPVANAVVSFDGEGGLPAAYSQPLELRQKDLRFEPYVLVVPLGASVEFPNLDRVRHHVYSFSKGNRFELQLYGREEHRAVSFDKAGTVAIGCNIHDMMLAYIKVSDAAFAGATDADGQVEIAGLAAEPGVATVWQPDMSGGKSVEVVPVLDGETLTLTLPARYAPPPPGVAK